ncbi:(Fe-S)-binding protein [bacterium]|nr:(Fe-S)-binding protein [candidate division CSSED10-310 bacterium]
MRLAVFIPCMTDVYYPETGMNLVRLLRRLGHDPVYPLTQTCCGQPAFNSGYMREATRAAHHFLDVFARLKSDYIIAPAGSCTSMVKHHYGALPLGAADRERWESLRGRLFEFSEFLVDVLGVTGLGGRLAVRASLHHGCHLLRELGVERQPLRLLEAVQDLELVELKRAKECCGFGGTFAVKFPELSAAMARDKLEEAVAADVERLVVSDSSCQMQLQGVAGKLGLPVRVEHIVDILAEALSLGEGA